MKIKNLTLLIVALISSSHLMANDNSLESLSMSLTNLATKSEELSKITEATFKKFYTNLEKAIRTSLISRKLDVQLFNRLDESSATKAAQFILKELFTYANQGSPYQYAVNHETEEVGNFVAQYREYEKLDIPFNDVVGQILLIARVIDDIIKNYSSTNEVSIISFNSFKGIFNTLFVEALAEQVKFKPVRFKLNLSLFLDSPNEEELETIQTKIKAIEGIEANTKHFASLYELVVSKSSFNIFLFDLTAQFNRAIPPSLVEITSSDSNKNSSLFTLVNSGSKKALAFMQNNISEDSKNNLFSKYIAEILSIKQPSSEENIKDYASKRINKPYLYLPTLLSFAKKEGGHSQIFMNNYNESILFEVFLKKYPEWEKLTYEFINIIEPKLLDGIQIFNFNLNDKKFIKFDKTGPSQTTVMEINW